MSESPTRAAAAGWDTPERDGLLVALGVAFVGLAFGAQAQADHASLAQAMFLSLAMFTGASQFAYLATLHDGGTVAAAISTAGLIGLRNALYGLAVRDYLPHRRTARHLASHLTIDESTAIATAAFAAASANGADLDQARRAGWRGFLWTGLGVFGFWNLGTAIGYLATSAIPDPQKFGLDVVFPASFLALMGPRFRSPDGRRVAAAALIIGAAMYPWAPAGTPVLASALAIFLARGKP